jgi:hypothetical protein
MKARYRRLLLRSLVVTPLLLALTLAPSHLWPAQTAIVGDFAAPMSAHAAEAVVVAARQAEEEQRARLAQELGAGSAAMLANTQTVYVSQTGYHLTDRSGFLTFWRKHGGVMIFGYPISEEMIEGGRVVQYFERARFEHHPRESNPEYAVQLSRLAIELTSGRDFPTVEPGTGERYFSETGHSISGPFYDFWRKRGGLQIFGYPISEPFEEINPVDGQNYTVQYFERARFEHHPEELPSFYREQARVYGLRLRGLYEVQLGDLGRQVVERRGLRFSGSPQQPNVPEWSPLLTTRRIEVNLTTQRLTAYEDDTRVFEAPVATGRDGFNTPPGSYAIYDRYPMQTMVGALGGETWYVPDVPWVQYVVGGVAIHGTYWHDLWGSGTRMSHGCINLNIDDAQWLYQWAGIGTAVNIFH